MADKIFPGQKTFLTMVDKLVTEHKRTWDPDQPPRDLTDAFMAEMETVRDSEIWCPLHWNNPVTLKSHHLKSSGGCYGVFLSFH